MSKLPLLLFLFPIFLYSTPPETCITFNDGNNNQSTYIARLICLQILRESNNKPIEEALAISLKKRKKPLLYPELTKMRKKLIRTHTYSDLSKIQTWE